MTNFDVAIVGAGPAGMMAAARAAARGRRTIVIDRNREAGVKILLSGGTRCNLTHATDARGIVAAFGPNGRFLHSALAALSPQNVIELFEGEGVLTKFEPGGKVFPASDRASDVRAALMRRVKQAGCNVATGEMVAEIVRDSAGFRLITDQREILAKKLLLATGGQSYPACGTTGDGYRWAAALGHRVVPPHTALVPITSHAPWVLALQGITLPDVRAAVVELEVEAHATKGRGSLAESRGALLFAHFGVTGPAAMDVSHAVSGHPRPSELRLRCDLLPELSAQELERELNEKTCQAGKRQVAGLLDAWLPRRVGETLFQRIGVSPAKPLAEFSKNERRHLIATAKSLEIPVAGTMGFRKAEVTAGGVALDEVDSRTMQSRLVPGLYFAGELLDLNGPIGGYNFQAAFSTGWLAGENV